MTRLKGSLVRPLVIVLALLSVGAVQAGNGGGGPDHDQRWREEARGSGRADEERELRQEYERERYERERGGVSGRGVNIPPGHLPPPGACRIWSVGLPPGQQPPPVPCERVPARDIGRGEVIVDHSGVYDPYGGWEDYYEREHPGTLPEQILDILEEMRRAGLI